MDVKGKPLTIYIGDDILSPLDRWAKNSKVSRSEAIRMIIADFFSRGENDA